MKKIFVLLCNVFVFYNIAYSDIINGNSFSHQDIGVKYNNEKPIQKILSPNKQYTAFNDKGEYIIITNINNEIIFLYKFDDEIKSFPTADYLYLYGWEENENVLWFYTYIPSEIAYIAKADIIKKTLVLYSIKTRSNTMEVYLDMNNKILYYSNYFHYAEDDNPDETFSLYKYDLITKNETIIISRKRKDGRFNPKIIDGKLVYNK
ncbi:MAG: hypothetical protein LBG95_04355 [Treponema sp.]|jgi:hypothetical protein|nr:hypothetical protein [Treponema sp.]